MGFTSVSSAIAFGPITGFLSRHVAVGFLLSSAIFFIDGYTSFRENKKDWINWLIIGAVVSAIGLYANIYYRRWLGVFVMALALAVEIWIMVKLWSRRPELNRQTIPPTAPPK